MEKLTVNYQTDDIYCRDDEIDFIRDYIEEGLENNG